MRRTLIALDADDKAWLDREARRRHVPMAELVQQAIRDYRRREESLSRPTLQTALAWTSGIWRNGDGLNYQQRLRDEWDPAV